MIEREGERVCVRRKQLHDKRQKTRQRTFVQRVSPASATPNVLHSAVRSSPPTRWTAPFTPVFELAKFLGDALTMASTAMLVMLPFHSATFWLSFSTGSWYCSVAAGRSSPFASSDHRKFMTSWRVVISGDVTALLSFLLDKLTEVVEVPGLNEGSLSVLSPAKESAEEKNRDFSSTRGFLGSVPLFAAGFLFRTTIV